MGSGGALERRRKERPKSAVFGLRWSYRTRTYRRGDVAFSHSDGMLSPVVRADYLAGRYENFRHTLPISMTA